MKSFFCKYLPILYLAVCVNIANAGGDMFPIQIGDIKTISDKEHHITFQFDKNKQISNYNEFKECEQINWIIMYQEWEFFHKILLFFKKYGNAQ